MADLTFGAVSDLLGLLATVIKDEAKLQGGVHGDVLFIRDELDSMNGFLLRLTKTESEHDDQLRAWMKQVREVAYIARDCMELYVSDVPQPKGDDGYCSSGVDLLCSLIPTERNRKRCNLAKKLRELKVRVKEVGERRLRYDVSVPKAAVLRRAAKLPGQDEREEEERRKEFRDALDDDICRCENWWP